MPQSVSSPSSLDNSSSWVLDQIDQVLNSAVNQPLATLFQWLFPLVAVALTIQFIVYAFLLMQGNGNMTVTEFFKKAIITAIVAGFFGAGGFFQTNIAEMMLSLPDDVARLTNNIADIGGRVDDLQKRASEASNVINSSGEGSFFNFLPSTGEVMATIMGFLIQANAVVVGAVITIIMIVCKVGMALVVMIAPFAIAAILFEPTKNIFNSWVAQALNYVFLGLLAGLIFGLALEINIVLFERVILELNTGQVDLLGVWGASFLIGIASIFILIQIPSLAAALSGGFGAQFGVGATASAGFSALRIKSMLRLNKLSKGKP